MIGREALTIRDVLALARGDRRAVLDGDPDYRAHLDAARRTVEKHLEAGSPIYGVTTGVGASIQNEIPADRRDELPLNLLRFHGTGTGPILGELEAAAIVAVRLVSLARGYSGVRPVLLERLCELLNNRLLPRVPEEGSVGASGDLTPLSYLAALVVGEREASLDGRVMTSAQALAEVGLEPLRLAPKESLSIMNGTSVMTALGCVAVERAQRLTRVAAAVTAMNVDVTRGNPGHFDARIFELKPHPGLQRVAAWIRDDLDVDAGGPGEPARLQDRYSIRCAPHVIGVLADALDFTVRILETELNGVDDNPLIDPERGDILHGGNFYGGHVCFVMDALKTAVANVADLLDRQLSLVCMPETSGGLPENLIAGNGEGRVLHHGFKAMQITASALTAEALKLTMPASVFSRSTESHNQDKVSMGTIAARDCLRILELTETVTAIVLLAACQALDLREGGSQLPTPLAIRDTVRKTVPMLREDRRQDRDIQRALELIRSGGLPLPGLDPA
ncbi:MAG: aromatic amino acid ammonia-lyase [Proteobacteria bacterium]|nr:aromatic amino acid ammonia-lyase [Pseudomonadota bacterium]